ncbi:MAG: PilN domain-containing protein [Planctomycetes bacterium]|nr:PilN domain-containing protein [Planctomycetota bacterium]
MQILNFVPEDYAQGKRARHANLLSALLVAAVIVPLVALSVFLSLAADRVETRRQEVERRESDAANDVARWEGVKRQRDAILERSSTSAKLLVGVPRSRLVAEVVRVLPPNTTLTSLSVEEKTIKTIVSAGAATTPGQQPPPPAANRPTTATKTLEHQETVLRLVGLAPTDVEAAQLIAALANSSYFDNVELSYSEDQKHEEHILRRFEITFELSDDAVRLSRKDKAEEVRS